MEDSPQSSSEDSKKSEKDEKSSSKKKKLGNKLVSNAEKKSGDPDKKSGKTEKPVSLVEFFKTPVKDIDKAPESEAPNDKMGKNEKALAASALAEEAAKDIPEHPLGTEISPDVASDLAASAFYEHLIETGDIAESAAEAAAELDIPTDEVISDESNEESVPVLNEGSTEETDFGEVKPEISEADEGIVFERIATGNRTEEPAPIDNDGHVPSELHSEAAVQAPPEPKNERASKKRETIKPASTALTGGIVGFLIGRRSGRANAEQNFQPMKKKLEKQVDDLHWQIRSQEVKLRKVAAEKVSRDGLEIRGPLVVRRAEQVQNVLVAKKIEKTEFSEPDRKSEQKSHNSPELPERQYTEQRRRAPEASQLHGAANAHEHIGHMLVSAAESAPAARLEKQVMAAGRESIIPSSKQQEKKTDKIAERFKDKSIETLNRAELMALSEKIVIDGSSLRQIYETHLIGERGLRRLVAEYLHGGNVKKQLRREIVEREIDFERDPALRDMNPHSSSSGSASANSVNKEALNKLLESASAGFGYSEDEAAFYKARDDYDAGKTLKKQSSHRVADVSLMATIVSLLAVIIILYIWSH